MRIIDYDTEVDIGKNRTADILLVVRRNSKEHRVVVEIENDRKFDVGEVLRKIKRDQLYPTVIIIPKQFQGHSYRFQKSRIPVWFWTARCKWSCRKCEHTTISDSSRTPNQCSKCEKSGSHVLSWIGAEDAEFEEAPNNPSLDFDKRQAEVLEQPLRIEDLLLQPQWVGEIKGYAGKVKVTNKGRNIVFNLTVDIDVERDGIHPEIFEVSELAKGRLTHKGKVLTTTRRIGIARDVENVWTNGRRSIFESVWKKLRQNDSATIYFPETRSEHILHFSSYTSEARLIRIMARAEHRVTVSVKGEDNEKNTVSATRTFRFTVKNRKEATGIYIA